MPANKETEKQYAELRKKFKLPDFKEIDFEFEISDLEETNFLLRAVIRKIADKLEFCSTMLEEILQPDTSNLYAMHETRFFDEQEKKGMNELYSKLMALNRHCIEVLLSLDEKEQVGEFGVSFGIEVIVVTDDAAKPPNEGPKLEQRSSKSGSRPQRWTTARCIRASNSETRCRSSSVMISLSSKIATTSSECRRSPPSDAAGRL